MGKRKRKKRKRKKRKRTEKKKKKKKEKDNDDEAKPKLLSKGSSAEMNSELDHRKLFKEGQRNLTPPVADSTRAFYESLLEENPESKIAIKFCVEYGVLPLENHRKVLKKYNHLKEKGAYSISQQIKRALDKKESKHNKENRENGSKDKKEGKDK